MAQNKAEVTQNLVEPAKKTAEVAEPVPEVAKEKTDVAKTVLIFGNTRNDTTQKAAEPTKKTAEVAKHVSEVAKKATESVNNQRETRQAPGRVEKSCTPSSTQNQVTQHPIPGQKAAQDQVNEEPKSKPTSNVVSKKTSSKTGSDETSADQTGNAEEEADEAPDAIKKPKTANSKKTAAASKKKETEQVVAPKRPTRSSAGGQNQNKPEQVPDESPLQSGANTLTVQEISVTLSKVGDESVTPSSDDDWIDDLTPSSDDDWIDDLEKKKQARAQCQLSQVNNDTLAPVTKTVVPSVAVANSDDHSEEDWLVDQKKKNTAAPAAKVSKLQPSKAADKSSKTDDLKSTQSPRRTLTEKKLTVMKIMTLDVSLMTSHPTLMMSSNLNRRKPDRSSLDKPAKILIWERRKN